MTVLVTGATGFTGGHLARALSAAGNTVRLLVRPGRVLPEDLTRACEIATGDLTDAASLREATRGCDAVYHIAALYRSEGARKLFFDINARGTDLLMAACAAAGVGRIVHCSTVGVHGHLHQVPGNENAPFAPGDDYQESKLEGEKIALAWFQRDGLPVSVFRPTGIYGPGDMRLLKFFRIVRKGRPLIGSGRPHYHLTHIDDLVRGIILCGTHPAALGEVFILGGPAAPTLNEWYGVVAKTLGVRATPTHLPVWPFLAVGGLAELLFKPFGKQPPIHRRSVHFFTHDRWFDISKARRMLGYEPAIGLEEGMRQTGEWYKANGLL